MAGTGASLSGYKAELNLGLDWQVTPQTLLTSRSGVVSGGAGSTEPALSRRPLVPVNTSHAGMRSDSFKPEIVRDLGVSVLNSLADWGAADAHQSRC